MHNRMRPGLFFLEPSAGDKLLAAARQVQLTLYRSEGDLKSLAAECEFELRGSFPLAGDGTALLLAIAAELRQPRQKKGGDQCA
jgi:hypothetical protein